MDAFRIRVDNVDLHIPFRYSEYLAKHEFSLQFVIDDEQAKLLEKYIDEIDRVADIELTIIPKINNPT